MTKGENSPCVDHACPGILSFEEVTQSKSGFVTVYTGRPRMSRSSELQKLESHGKLSERFQKELSDDDPNQKKYPSASDGSFP